MRFPTSFAKKSLLPAAFIAVLMSPTIAAEQEIVATVNGVAIPASRLLIYAQNTPINDSNRDALIDNLITGEIIAQAAKASGVAEQPDVQEQLAVAEQSILGRAYVNNFFAENPIDAAQIDKRYNDMAAQAENEYEYNVAHILVEDEATATELLEQITADPESFAALAEENSKDPGSAANGGSLGWVAAPALVKEFADALRSLEKGEMTTAPVKTDFGWHIIRMDDRRAIQVPPLTDELRQRIEQGERSEQFARHIDTLRSNADIDLK